MANSQFHLEYTDVTEARQQGVLLCNQGVQQWNQRNDAVGSILYAQGGILGLLADVLREQNLNNKLLEQVAAVDNKSPNAEQLLLAVSSLSVSAQCMVQSALNTLAAMKSCVLYAEQLNESADPRARVGVDIHLGISESSQEIVKQALRPLGVLRAQATQILHRYKQANKVV